MKEPFVIAGMKDVEAIEAVPFDERVAETNTFAVLEKGAAIEPQSVAISFLLNGDSWDQPVRITYGDLIHKIRQCAKP